MRRQKVSQQAISFPNSDCRADAPTLIPCFFAPRTHLGPAPSMTQDFLSRTLPEWFLSYSFHFASMFLSFGFHFVFITLHVPFILMFLLHVPFIFLSCSFHLAFMSFHFPSLLIKHTGLRRVICSNRSGGYLPTGSRFHHLSLSFLLSCCYCFGGLCRSSGCHLQGS